MHQFYLDLSQHEGTLFFVNFLSFIFLSIITYSYLFCFSFKTLEKIGGNEATKLDFKHYKKVKKKNKEQVHVLY